MSKKGTVWNHNYAYHPYIARQVAARKRILDVGCGDGTLALFLRTDTNTVIGIDPSGSAVQKAKEKNIYSNVSFYETSFEKFSAEPASFDAVIFVASLHHMDMKNAAAKAKMLLAPGGILLIVGLAKPTGLWDWCVEILRVIPCKVISALKKHTDSEEIGLAVSYKLPAMDEVRELCRDILPGASLRHGLYYRYLLRLENKE